MARAKLDDQFDVNEGFLDALSAMALHHLRKPANIAWSVGIAGAVGFVFTNALFFQQGAHPAAIFETRSSAVEHKLKADELDLPVNNAGAISKPEESTKSVTRIVFDPNAATVPTPERRPAAPQQVLNAVEEGERQLASTPSADEGNSLSELQGLLAQLGFYEGDVDGLDGPKTQKAIETYKANVGLKGIDLTHEQLITSTKNNLIVTAAIPKARPETTSESSVGLQENEVKTVGYTPPTPKKVAAQPSNTIAKVQAGLRAFGNEAISVDGIAGDQTTQAIQEFQILFKLPVTGKIDGTLIAKMTDVGLID